MTSLTRREYLLGACGGVGTALAGCNRPFEPSEFQRRQVSVLSVGTVPSDIPYSLSVQVSRPNAVPDHPPQFSISITNESDERKHIEDKGVPNNLYLHHSSPEGYILIHWDEIERRKENCWVSKDQYGMGGFAERTELQPNETTTGEISLWGTEDASTCWPTGEFSIPADIAIKEYTPGVDDSTLWTFEWVFRFEVTQLE